MSEPTQPIAQEPTLKDMIELVKDWYSFLLTKWKIIVVLGLSGGILGITVATFSKIEYQAELTFALEEKGAGSGFSGLASQLGLDIGGSSGGAFVGENNIELLKSRNIIEKSLLTPVVIDGKKQLLINYYLDFTKTREKWEKSDPELYALVYSEDEKRENFGVKKDSILYAIYKNIRKNNLIVEKVDKKLSIIRVKVKSFDEAFSKYFAEVLVSAASTLYIETKTAKSKANVEILESRLDSVKRALDENIYGAAFTKDQNMNAIRAQGNISFAKKQLNVQVLTTMYGELIKNTELAKFTLMREEPLIQIIDKPYFPLDRKKLGRGKGGIIGGFLGGILGIAIAVGIRYKKMYLDGVYP